MLASSQLAAIAMLLFIPFIVGLLALLWLLWVICRPRPRQPVRRRRY